MFRSCALFRLIGIEETCRKQKLPYRQVFVTKVMPAHWSRCTTKDLLLTLILSLQSPVLASKIKDYYLKLRQTLDISGMSPKEVKEANAKAKDAEIELNDNENLRMSLPTKWSELEDKHFPLFLAFDHLCALLEADLDIDRIKASALAEERQRAHRATRVGVSSTDDKEDDDGVMDLNAFQSFLAPEAAVEQNTWLHRVDGDSFVQYYWPHFDQRLTKNLDPLLCYAEFIGVLSGSEEASSHENVSLLLAG